MTIRIRQIFKNMTIKKRQTSKNINVIRERIINLSKIILKLNSKSE
jgi:hypothetical protein